MKASASGTVMNGGRIGVALSDAKKHAPLIIEVLFNEQKRRVLVDTGADITLLNEPISGVCVDSAGGSTITGITGIQRPVDGKQTLTLRLGSSVVEHEVWIAPLKFGADGILGMDVLCKLAANIDISKGIVRPGAPGRIDVCSVQASHNCDEITRDRTTARTKETIVVPPSSELITAARIHGYVKDKEVILEPVALPGGVARAARVVVSPKGRNVLIAKRINKGRRQRNLLVGDLVYIKTSAPFGKCRKFSVPCKGPFRVVEKLSPVNYKIEIATGKYDIMHIDRLKFCPQNFDDGDGDCLAETESDQEDDDDRYGDSSDSDESYVYFHKEERTTTRSGANHARHDEQQGDDQSGEDVPQEIVYAQREHYSSGNECEEIGGPRSMIEQELEDHGEPEAIHMEESEEDLPALQELSPVRTRSGRAIRAPRRYSPE